MGSNCPLHNAQPFGAKPKLKILISERNGSAMIYSLGLRLQKAIANRRCDVYRTRSGSEGIIPFMIRSHPPPQAGCPIATPARLPRRGPRAWGPRSAPGSVMALPSDCLKLRAEPEHHEI